MSIIMVVDIGGSKYMPGFVDLDGQILYQEKREWTAVDQQAIVDQLKGALHSICIRHPELAKQVKAGGLTIPGFADPMTGMWVESDFLPVKDLPICEILSDEFGIPFFADNDGNACAMAEKYFGGAKRQSNFLYMTVSTGIGGALYLDDELYYGAFYHAGEIGLFVVEEYGRLSDTGSVQGIVEMYASGRGLTENFIAVGGVAEIDGKPVGGVQISQLTDCGDRTALGTLALEGRYLGRIIANACAFADFKKIILGGGVALMFDRFQDALWKEFHAIHPDSEVVIEATKLGYSGAFLGAAAVAIRGLQGFEGSRGSSQEQNILRFHIDDGVQAVLELDNQIVNQTSCLTGEFLVARGIEDIGYSLNRCLAGEKGKNPQVLGEALGKAVACASVLLDPGQVIIEGNYPKDKGFQEGLREAVIRETYYRGNLPFTLKFK